MKLQSILFAALCIVGADVHAQGWRQIYPAWLAETYTSITRTGSDTAYVTGLNFTLQRTTNAGSTWQTLFHTPGAYDIWRSGWDGRYLWLLPGGWPYYSEVLKDTTLGFLFRFDPRTNDTARVMFPARFTHLINGSRIHMDLSVNMDAIFVLVRDGVHPRSILLRSTDQGTSWEDLPLADSLRRAWGMNFGDRDHGVLFLSYGMQTQRFEPWSTSNGGVLAEHITDLRFPFQDINAPMEPPVCWVDDSTLVAVSDLTTLWVSRDYGQHWAQRAGTLPLQATAVRISADGRGYVTGDGMEVFVTSDFGNTWISVRQRSTPRHLRCAGALTGRDSFVMIAETGELSCTNDGGHSWQDLQQSDIAYFSSDPVFVSPMVGYVQGLAQDVRLYSGMWKTADGGHTWSRWPEQKLGSRIFFPVTEQRVFAFGLNSDSLCMKSEDGGDSWRVCLADTLNAQGQWLSAFQSSECMHRGSDTVFMRRGGNLVCTSDGGRSWFTYPSLPVSVQPVGLSFRQQGCVWAITDSSVLRSTDDGRSWDAIQGLPIGAQRFTKMTDFNQNSMAVLASFWDGLGTRGKMLMTSDRGMTWTLRNLIADDPGLGMRANLFGNGMATGLIYDSPVADGGRRYSVSISHDFWSTSISTLIRHDAPRDFYSMCFLDENNGWLIIGNRLYFTSTGGVDAADHAPLPQQLSLGQNYPNPSVLTTVIPYTLRAAGRVRLELYDTMGRLIRTLRDADDSAGEHVLPIDTQDLRAGMYFVRIHNANTSIVRKIAIIR